MSEPHDPMPPQPEGFASAETPPRFCDLVMKGGITSGVVYPLAAVKLAERFVFKNVGGTSAGAIAAAATAAAELARERGGFERLKELPAFLSGTAPDGKGSNLFAFFQPQAETARLFRVGVAGLGGGKAAVARVLWTTILHYPLAALGGILLPTVFLALAGTNAHGSFLLICIVLGVLVLLLGLAFRPRGGGDPGCFQNVATNFYGLCSRDDRRFSFRGARWSAASCDAWQTADLLAHRIPQRIRVPAAGDAR